MEEKDLKLISNLIRNDAENDILKAADRLREFAKKYAPFTHAEFKSDFLRAGVILALQLPDLNERKRSLDQLQFKIEILSNEILKEHTRSENYGLKNSLIRLKEEGANSFLANNKIVIECTGVVKKFVGEKFKLGTINAQFRLGEITGLVGLNSHGKSTLLRIIAKDLHPDYGYVEYFIPDDSDKKKLHKMSQLKIGYLPQSIVKEFGSVKENLQLTAALSGIFGKENDHEVEYIIYRMGLSEKSNTACSLLSGGLKLRYSIAKLLVTRPDVLILDEPLANLDFKAQNNLLKDLASLAKSIRDPLSIIISSQHIEEVESVADKMMVLKNGELIYDGNTNYANVNLPGNLFEIKSSLSFEELKMKFEKLEYKSLINESFYFFVYTSEHISRDYFLKYCTLNNIDLIQFNDISKSVKRLVLESNNQ